MTGPLKAPCKEHGMYDAHPTSSGFGDYSKPPLVFDCPGGILLPEDTLVIQVRGLTASTILKALERPDSKWARGTILDAATALADALTEIGGNLSDLDRRSLDTRNPPDLDSDPHQKNPSVIPPDTLVIVKEDGEWPSMPLGRIAQKICRGPLEHEDESLIPECFRQALAILDALAAAQRGDG